MMNKLASHKLHELFMNLLAAQSREACWEVYVAYVKTLGITGGALLTGREVDGKIQGYDCLSFYTAPFWSDYQSVGGVSNDLLCHYLYSTRDAENQTTLMTDWRVLTDNALETGSVTTQELLQNQVLEASLDHSIIFGFGGCFRKTADRSTGLAAGVGLCHVGGSLSSFENEVASHQLEVEQATNMLDLCLSRFGWQTLGFDAFQQQLTKREQSLIRWLAEGLRLKAIADKPPYVSESKLNKEIALLKTKMQVKTLEELTVLGVRLNLL